MMPTELDALLAFVVAAGVAGALTPLTMRLATRTGAVDEPRERGLSARATPLLGGLAIFAGVLGSTKGSCSRPRSSRSSARSTIASTCRPGRSCSGKSWPR